MPLISPRLHVSRGNGRTILQRNSPGNLQDKLGSTDALFIFNPNTSTLSKNADYFPTHGSAWLLQVVVLATLQLI